MSSRTHAAIKRKVDDDLYHLLLENLFEALNAPNVNMPPLHDCTALTGAQYRKLYHRIIYALLHDHSVSPPKIWLLEQPIVKELVNYHEVLGEIHDKVPADNFGNVRYIYDELHKLELSAEYWQEAPWIKLYQSSLIFTSHSPIDFANAYFGLTESGNYSRLPEMYCKIYNGLRECYGRDQSIFEEVIGDSPTLSIIHNTRRN